MSTLEKYEKTTGIGGKVALVGIGSLVLLALPGPGWLAATVAVVGGGAAAARRVLR